MKTLVVYYTRTGNTKFAAENIAAELGAEVEEVVDLKNRQGRLAYMSCGKDAMSGKETEISQTTKKPSDYDLIIIAQPIWAWSPTPAIRTYINKNDLSGKKVALFFSGENLGKAIEKTTALMPNSTLVSQLALNEKTFGDKEETKKRIAEWCNTLKMISLDR